MTNSLKLFQVASLVRLELDCLLMKTTEQPGDSQSDEQLTSRLLSIWKDLGLINRQLPAYSTEKEIESSLEEDEYLLEYFQHGQAD